MVRGSRFRVRKDPHPGEPRPPEPRAPMAGPQRETLGPEPSASLGHGRLLAVAGREVGWSPWTSVNVATQPAGGAPRARRRRAGCLGGRRAGASSLPHARTPTMPTDHALGAFLRDRLGARLDPADFGFVHGPPADAGPPARGGRPARPHERDVVHVARAGAGRRALRRRVLDRVAGALVLTPAEREHLFLLAHGRPPEVREPVRRDGLAAPPAGARRAGPRARPSSRRRRGTSSRGTGPRRRF